MTLCRSERTRSVSEQKLKSDIRPELFHKQAKARNLVETWQMYSIESDNREDATKREKKKEARASFKFGILDVYKNIYLPKCLLLFR